MSDSGPARPRGAPDDFTVAQFDDTFTARVCVPLKTALRPLAEIGASPSELLARSRAPLTAYYVLGTGAPKG